jgi:hypothetical protein
MAWISLVILALGIAACGNKEDAASRDQKVKEAVEQAITKEMKMYESAKQALEKIEKQTEERREKEAK